VNHYFLTFTLDPEKFPWVYDINAYERVPELWNAFKERHFDTFLKKPDLKYLAVPEFLAKGRNHWHIHVLVNKKPFFGTSRTDFVKGTEIMAQNWGCGRVQIEKIGSLKWWGWKKLKPSSDLLASYVCKYMIKNLIADVFPRGKRRYYPSKNLIKPVVLYSDMDPMRLESAPMESLVTTVHKNYDHVGEVDVSTVHPDVPWYQPLLPLVP
jgi:hypothetical protein